MSQPEPRIVHRLPSHRERILNARFRDRVVDELCRDYDTVFEVHEKERSEVRKRELLDLMCSLEKELLDRINMPQNKRRTG